MNYARCVIGVIVALLILVPCLAAGHQETMPGLSVWVLDASPGDIDTGVAVQILRHEMTHAGLGISETSLNRLASVPLDVGVLVLVGHGQPDGLMGSGGVVLWSELYEAIAERRPQRTIVLACYSPSDSSSGVFGFGSSVDAEDGAIVVSWYLQQLLDPEADVAFPLDRVALAQVSMLHPLGRYLYFVHGYWGSDSDFQLMYNYFDDMYLFKTDYDEASVKYFDYFEAYGATTQDQKDIVHWAYFIPDFAENLFNDLASLPSGSQVNIITHSMGGIIVRQMLKDHRASLDTEGISIGKVLTLGAPHTGTWLANPLNVWSVILTLIGGIIPSCNLWPSPVFWSMTPGYPLMYNLNLDPLSYSSGIEWCTISGYDVILSALLWFIHFDNSDPIVAAGRAHLAFAEQAFFNVGHSALVNDPVGTTYSYIADWITSGPDSDSDGLTDDAETYCHLTDPHDTDTDDDGLNDYAEVVTYDTDPRDDNTDGDGLTDGYEVQHGYDPLDINDPVPATQLISSVTLVGSKVMVYVNHYTIMDYVDFYVRYKTAYGSWTTYSNMGRDYTPDSGGKYYAMWTYPTGYSRMEVKVMAYDSSGRWLGTDYHTCDIGGGGPPPE